MSSGEARTAPLGVPLLLDNARLIVEVREGCFRAQRRKHRPSHACCEHLDPFVSMVHVQRFHGCRDIFQVGAQCLSQTVGKIGKQQRLAVRQEAAGLHDPGWAIVAFHRFNH